MLLDFYKLPEQPFGITPDPRFVFLSETHKQALASLLHSIQERRSFLLFVAEPGLGKTTVLSRLVLALRGQACTVLLLHKAMEPAAMLSAMLAELGIAAASEGVPELQARLEVALLDLERTAWRFVLVLDEAQDLSDASLELLRTLSNIETPREKLLQIVLCGQPALAARLSAPGLVQLRQRVSVGVRLKQLSPQETEQYIHFRLKAAGYLSKDALFTQEALTLVTEFAQGVPRNVNRLCINALSAGYAQKRKTVHGAIVRAVAADLNFGSWQDEAIALARSENAAPVVNTKPLLVEAKPSPAQHLTKLALVATVLLAVGASLYQGGVWWAAHATKVQRSVSLAPPTTAFRTASRSITQASRAGGGMPEGIPAAVRSRNVHVKTAKTVAAAYSPAHAIRVGRGQTLLGICTGQFGNCDHRLLLWIRALNPRLRDLDHIQPGETIQLPVLGTIETSAQPLKNLD